MEKKLIKLPRGGTLELEVTNEFIGRVAKHFDVAVEALDDDQLRSFLWGSVKNALDKFERS